MPPLSEGEIWAHVGSSMRKLVEDYPPDAHLFCPKLDDLDDAIYDPPEAPDDTITAEEKHKRLEDARDRQITAYYLSILLSIEQEEAKMWRQTWETRVEQCLSVCDSCVRMWHKQRTQFLEALIECVFLARLLFVPGHR